jgi:hypothetical protein
VNQIVAWLSGRAGLEGRAPGASYPMQSQSASKMPRQGGTILYTRMCQVRCREREEYPLSNCLKYLPSTSVGGGRLY